ncbi:hypothetical protein M0813_26458 [Anaeramoeba flamelloides]|uniref:Uncharacterized protein n=1 Tax=Anaeramoeba flamelloides TaxID=1746091 RepID=A0ABQ8XZ59_9EUKA|nr:hypothetical protein M0813_26458 [Anaeramoeba flamelloides]
MENIIEIIIQSVFNLGEIKKWFNRNFIFSVQFQNDQTNPNNRNENNNYEFRKQEITICNQKHSLSTRESGTNQQFCIRLFEKKGNVLVGEWISPKLSKIHPNLNFKKQILFKQCDLIINFSYCLKTSHQNQVVWEKKYPLLKKNRLQTKKYTPRFNMEKYEITYKNGNVQTEEINSATFNNKDLLKNLFKYIKKFIRHSLKKKGIEHKVDFKKEYQDYDKLITFFLAIFRSIKKRDLDNFNEFYKLRKFIKMEFMPHARNVFNFPKCTDNSEMAAYMEEIFENGFDYQIFRKIYLFWLSKEHNLQKIIVLNEDPLIEISDQNIKILDPKKFKKIELYDLFYKFQVKYSPKKTDRGEYMRKGILDYDEPDGN